MITEPLPLRVKAVLGQRLFIEKAGLPSPLLNQLMRLAAFQNPEFYKKQSMRLSTALTPRVIACAEDLPEHIALPRGCLPEAEALLRRTRRQPSTSQDEREAGKAVDFTFQGTLTPLQEQAVKALLAHDTGVFVAPPGIGKTVVGTYLVAARKTSTLILVHRKPLLDQWIGQLALFLGIEPKDIGQIGAGKAKPNGRLDVAMVQSLVRKGSVADLVAGYGQVIQDESHHCPAVSFERVLAEVKAKYVVGPHRDPAAPRRPPSHPPHAARAGAVRRRRQRARPRGGPSTTSSSSERRAFRRAGSPMARASRTSIRRARRRPATATTSSSTTWCAPSRRSAHLSCSPSGGITWSTSPSGCKASRAIWSCSTAA